MLNYFVNGLKVFINKRTPLFMAFYLLVFFGINYISNTLIDEEIILGISLKEYPSFLINYYGLDLLWVLLGIFAISIISNYLMYLISHTINKSKRNIYADIYNCIIYTLLIALFFSFLGLMLYFLILYMGWISLFLFIILIIITIVVVLITNFGILFLPVSKNIKDSLNKSWWFIRKKFWLMIVLFIIIGILSYGFVNLFNLLGLYFKSNSAKIVLFIIINTISTMYTIAVFSSFIKKRK